MSIKRSLKNNNSPANISTSTGGNSMDDQKIARVCVAYAKRLLEKIQNIFDS